LKQFAALTIEDFAQYPVWIACHVADYDEPWYDDTDDPGLSQRGAQKVTTTLRSGNPHFG
jgi:hypothetical protein